MIKIDGQLCYSPFPPERYGTSRAGFNISCRQDLQLWNLLYLTCEGINDHLDPSSDADVGVLVERDIEALVVTLAAFGTSYREQFPGLRDALKQHPVVFLSELWKMPWENLPQVQQFPDWGDLVIDKVAVITSCISSQLASFIPGYHAGNFFGEPYGRTRH